MIMEENKKEVINPAMIDKGDNMKGTWDELFLMNPAVVKSIIDAVKEVKISDDNFLAETQELTMLKRAVEIYTLLFYSSI